MKLIQQLFLLILFFLEISSFEFDWVPGHHDYEMHKKYDSKKFINEWTVALDGGEEIAQLVAWELGYVYGGPVQGFPNLYVFHAQNHTMKRGIPSVHTSTLLKDRRIRWAEQLYTKTRVKRYPIVGPDEELHRVKRENMTGNKNHKKSNTHNRNSLFNDELWSYEWYLQDTRTGDSLPRLDLNVLPVYAMGYDGRGVRVSVLDDGIEHNHTDLRANYDPEISWDCNDRDSDPYPKHGENYKNSHGTRCAGEIAMTANNKKCGVGVAWGARVGGVRMLDGRITDRVEGEAIGYAWEKVDIYSASWGPSDDGKTVEGPGRLAVEALKRGVTRGRGGKGTIYVWANGNGGGNYDNCNCDGYSSSIYTISIGSASQQGLFPWYGEICSSTLATAYSSGAYKDQKIATTDIYDSCTVRHTGTSAAAPLAAGIIALVLHANPNLTWRDVQHLIVWTSEYFPLSKNIGWQMNGIGLYFDVRFGFGLLNAGALVSAALNWTNVPEKTICRSVFGPSKKKDGLIISSKKTVTFKFEISKCGVNYIEHVELVINVQYSRRGALEIYLTSPQGTTVALLSARPKDNSKDGFVNWPLTSVATWGERANGLWRITFKDMTGEQNSGYVNPFTLIVHGTHEMPAHMMQGPRKYNNDYSTPSQNSNGFVDSDFDDITLIIPGDHNFDEATYKDLETLDEIGEGLLREHHSKQEYKSNGIN